MMPSAPENLCQDEWEAIAVLGDDADHCQHSHAIMLQRRAPVAVELLCITSILWLGLTNGIVLCWDRPMAS